jgi:hypothetical protein
MAENDGVNLATLGAEAELVQLGQAVAGVLGALNEVTRQQQRGILRLVVDARAACGAPAPEAKLTTLPPVEPAASPPPAPTAPSAGPSHGHPDEVRARALAQVYETAAQALGAAFQNAVANQHSLNTLAQAALSQSAVLVLSSDSGEESPPAGPHPEG